MIHPSIKLERTTKWHDVALITALVIPFILVVVATQTGQIQTAVADTSWYFNRAVRLGSGHFDGTFIYTIVFPFMVSIIDKLTNDLVGAAILLNTLALYFILLGTYVLGCYLFSRPIALLSVLLTACNISLIYTAQILWPDILFICIIMWCIILTRSLIRQPSWLKVTALAFLIILAFYTRLEGIAYSVLLIYAGCRIYQRNRDIRRVLRLVLSAAAIICLGIIPYLVIFRATSHTADSQIEFLQIVGMSRWDLIWPRLFDTTTFLLERWPVWCWIIVLAFVCWNPNRYQESRWFLVGLIILNFVYVFLLVNWPTPRYLVQYIPFFALLLTACLWQTSRKLFRWRFVIACFFVILCIPGLSNMIKSAKEPIFGYLTSPQQIDVEALDSWLTAKGWQTHEIYTLCQDVTPFSHANWNFIYRLVFDMTYENPKSVLAEMQKTDKLFMVCPNHIHYTYDWDPYLSELADSSNATGTIGSDHLPRLIQIGQFRQFIFYTVAHDS